jgi:hypothetical protein
MSHYERQIVNNMLVQAKNQWLKLCRATAQTKSSVTSCENHKTAKRIINVELQSYHVIYRSSATNIRQKLNHQ